MADICGGSIISGTCPFVSYIELAECDLISSSSSMQWPQSTFGDLVHIIFLDTPLFSSQMALSAAFIQGEYGSVCQRWQPASLSFHLKSPSVCSFEPSITITGGTPSRWKRRDNASCLSPFLLIRNARVHPKGAANTCEYLLPWLECLPATRVSVKMVCGSRVSLSSQSFVGNRLDRVGLMQVLNPVALSHLLSVMPSPG